MAEINVQELNIKLKVDWDKRQVEVAGTGIKQLTEEIKKGAEETKKKGISLLDLAKAFGIANIAAMGVTGAINKLTQYLREGVQAAIENEVAISKLSFRLKTLGEKDLEKATKSLEEFTKSLAEASIFQQTEMVQGLETLIKYTGDVASAQKMLIIATKLATAEHKSLNEVVTELGTAIAMPEYGMRRLRREYGSLVGDAKNVTEALENISKNLSKTGEGTLTLEQQVKKLSKVWKEEILEKVGKWTIEVIRWFIEDISKVIRWVEKLITGSDKLLTDYSKKRLAELEKTTKKSLTDLEKEFEKHKIKIKKDEEKLKEIQEKQAEERRKVEEKIKDEIARIKGETYQRAKELLEKELDEYRKLGVDKELLAQYEASKRLEIEKQMQEELEKITLENFQKQWGWASDVINSITDSFKQGMVEMIDTGNITAESLEQIWERIKKSFINAITSMIAEYVAKMAVITAVSGITGLPFGVVMKGMGWGGKGLFGLLGLQEGGIVKKPTVAVIGEKGPEAVIPLSKAQNFGLGSVNVNINAFDLRSISQQQIERFVRQIKYVLNKELKR